MNRECFELMIIRVLERINSGAWLQLEERCKRWCNMFIEIGVIVKDQDKYKIDWDELYFRMDEYDLK